MNKNTCLICLKEEFFIKKSPCNICKNAKIHKKCLEEYFKNTSNNKCFVCNNGYLRNDHNSITLNIPQFIAVSHEHSTTNCMTYYNFIKKIIFMTIFTYLLGFIPTYIILKISIKQFNELSFVLIITVPCLIGMLIVFCCCSKRFIDRYFTFLNS